MSDLVRPGVSVGVNQYNGEWFVMLVQGSSWSWMTAEHARLVADQLHQCADAIAPPQKSDPAPSVEGACSPQPVGTESPPDAPL